LSANPHRDQTILLLQVKDLKKHYPTPRGELSVLAGVELSLSLGDAVSIMGPSGGGKSTLLYILGALEPPTSGTVRLGGRNPYDLDEKEIAAFRNERVGFVFQDHHLLPQCSVLENVLTPTLVAPLGEDYPARARHLVDQVGLTDRIDHRPFELSGGEKQRVAVARALIRDPNLLLCDEPTGNLDPRSAEAVASLLLEVGARDRRILIVVTHSAELAARFPRRRQLVGGKLTPA